MHVSFFSFNVVDGSKYPFQLTSYLASECPPEAIMFDNIISNPDVDPVIVIPESPGRLPRFGPNAYLLINFSRFLVLILFLHVLVLLILWKVFLQMLLVLVENINAF